MAGPVTTERRGSIAVIIVDNPPVNALSQAVRQGLDKAAATASSSPWRTAWLRALTGGLSTVMTAMLPRRSVVTGPAICLLPNDRGECSGPRRGLHAFGDLEVASCRRPGSVMRVRSPRI